MVVVTRRLEHEKRQLEARLHILDALAKIYDDLDRAIRIIRKSESRADAAKELMAAFKLDQVQADAILEIRLYQLARLEIEKIRAERAEKRKRLKEIEALLAKPKERWKLIRDELDALGEKYGDKRRTALRRRRGARVRPRGATSCTRTPTVVLSRDGWLKRVREVKDPSADAPPRGRRAGGGAAGDDARPPRALLDPRHASTCSASPTCRRRPATASRCSRSSSSATASAWWPRGSCASRCRRRPSQARRSRASRRRAGAGRDGARATASAPTPDLSETTRAGRRLARVGEGDEIVSVEPVAGPVVVVATARGKMLRFALDEVRRALRPGPRRHT